MLVFTGVYVCVKAKLTLVSFFVHCFFCSFPLQWSVLGQSDNVADNTVICSITIDLSFAIFTSETRMYSDFEHRRSFLKSSLLLEPITNNYCYRFPSPYCLVMVMLVGDDAA